jgi:hypothetical protein
MQDDGVRELIGALGRTLIDGAVVYDDEGRAAFEAADGLTISIDHLPNTHQILLHAELGCMPGGQAGEDLALALLHANLELAANHDGALALDVGSGTVALFARRGAEALDFGTFESWVGDLVEVAETWRRQLVPVAAAEPD